MKKFLLSVLVFTYEGLWAASYTQADIEFIAKSNDSISYINSVEARELQIAEISTSLLEDLSSFYTALQAAGVKGSKQGFLDRRLSGLTSVSELVKADAQVATKALENKLDELSKSKAIVFREKSSEQSLAVIIHLYARNQAAVLKKATPDIAYLAGRAAFHSSLLGGEYLRRFLDLSSKEDKRSTSAREMLSLIDAVKKTDSN